MRVHIQQDRNRVINRIGRLLETVNSKLGSVASNILGKNGRAMLNLLAAGIDTGVGWPYRSAFPLDALAVVAQAGWAGCRLGRTGPEERRYGSAPGIDPAALHHTRNR